LAGDETVKNDGLGDVQLSAASAGALRLQKTTRLGTPLELDKRPLAVEPGVDLSGE
jgi:hypothetical protein